MKISVISRWVNEEFLAPFFLSHYQFADEIIVYLDTATTDHSAGIIQKYRKTELRFTTSPGGLNDRFLVDLINNAVARLDSDWVIAVDADEFIFDAKEFRNPRTLIESADGNLIYAHFWQIYRNRLDAPLNPNEPAIFQRRYGDPNRTEGINAMYKKPIIIRPSTGIRWEPGHHTFEKNDAITVSSTILDGAHWTMAELNNAIERRIKGRRDRFSRENRRRKWGGRWFDITENDLRREYEKHIDDPRLF